MICSSKRNRVTMSKYRLRAQNTYSSGETPYFLCLPPKISCVSNTKYCRETEKEMLQLPCVKWRCFSLRRRSVDCNKAVLCSQCFAAGNKSWQFAQLGFSHRLLHQLMGLVTMFAHNVKHTQRGGCENESTARKMCMIKSKGQEDIRVSLHLTSVTDTDVKLLLGSLGFQHWTILWWHFNKLNFTGLEIGWVFHRETYHLSRRVLTKENSKVPRQA